LYHSDTTTNVPTTIVSGELAANTVDGKLFLGTGTNTYKTLLNVGSSTITVGGNLTFSGAFSTTLTVTGTTTGTLPTSGYLISTATNMAANPVTGTPSSSNFLRGDGTWATPASTTPTSIANGTSNVTVNSSGGTVSVATAGTTALTVDTSQKVGIGTSSPSTTLHVKSTVNDSTNGLTLEYNAGTAYYQRLYSSGNDFYISADTGNTGGTMRFLTGGSERMRIDSSGNVELGTTTSKVTVIGGSGSGMTIGGSGTPNISVYNTTNASYVTSLGVGNDGTAYLYNNANTSTVFSTNAVERMRIDSSGNVGIGTTSPSTYGKFVAYSSGGYGSIDTNGQFTSYQLLDTASAGGRITGYSNQGLLSAVGLEQTTTGSKGGYINFRTCASGTNTLTEAARFDSSGNLLVGTTGSLVSSASRIRATTSVGTTLDVQQTGGASAGVAAFWNTATSGDNLFNTFYTEAGGSNRGSITYNRAGGLVVYNTTSDYRAKDISGPVTNSGSLIDSVPVYMGKMKWATEERPMFIAHETPAYAHTGEKDAVDKDGNPVYQQMDASALIPVMWAEIQSLRKRIATLESK